MPNGLPRRTDVLVVGGGPVGLVLSALLSREGVGHVVVERRRETCRAPAAHVLRRRPMQILDGLGVGEAVRRAAPPLSLDAVTWCATLAGTVIGRLDLRAGRGGEPWTNCPQNLLEPILLRRARRAPQARIAHGTECVGIAPSGGGIVARVRDVGGVTQPIEAAWVVAADGAGSPTRRTLGIPMQGPGPLARLSMVHFEADLRPWIEGRSGPLFWILNPESPGTLIVHDPARSHVFMLPRGAAPEGQDAAAWEARERAAIPQRLVAALGVRAPTRILAVDAWSPHVQVAARYRAGRVLLVGDAAHRFPPTGGLGLNTGLQEAPVLARALADVLAGRAGEEALEAYEAACRPMALANAAASFENLKRLGEIPAVLGACADLPALEKRLASLDADERTRLARAIERQRSHFLSEGAAARSDAAGWS